MHPGACLPRTSLSSHQTTHPSMATSFLPTHLLFLPARLFFHAIALPTLAAPSSGSASLPKSIFPRLLFFGYFRNLLVVLLLATLWVLAGCCHFYFFQVGMAYPSLGKMMGIASSLPLPFSRLSSCALFKALKCALVRVWIYALCKACQRAFSN